MEEIENLIDKTFRDLVSGKSGSGQTANYATVLTALINYNNYKKGIQ